MHDLLTGKLATRITVVLQDLQVLRRVEVFDYKKLTWRVTEVKRDVNIAFCNERCLK